MSNTTNTVTQQAKSAKQAAKRLAHTSTPAKNDILKAMVAALKTGEKKILDANAADLKRAKEAGLSTALLDRLTLTPARMQGMISALNDIAALPDPLGKELDHFELKNGLQVLKVAVPLGVLGFIYEARPNVTTDAVGLALKSGNAIILKGGKEAIQSNRAIVSCLRDAIQDPLLKDAIQFIDSTDRADTLALLAQTDTVDLIIPRGGKTLIQAVMEHSKIPVLQHLDGICHVYVDESANETMAEKIVVNAKCQRPGVCNAAETLLVHKNIAASFLPKIGADLHAQGVELRGCKHTQALIKDTPVKAATEDDWRTEYLDLIIAIKMVDSVEDAVEHINTYGSHHSDSIITENKENTRYFFENVDSAVIYHNASTRFTDGGAFGFGAEMGISTGKLHARGPVGLKELTTYQYRVEGHGQTRD